MSVKTTKAIQVEPGSEIARLLDEMRGQAMILVKDGVRYRIELAEGDDIWAGYDPKRVREALRQTAGVLKGLDRDAFLAELREMRGQDSEGRPA
ncbi:MAG TPA: hypothetical protein VGR16_08920 [Thermomicrobiales bacterium]|nr:hypothetical protein [Thermomicrobiales bacterium]